MTDITTIIGDAFGSIINTITGFFTGIIDALLSPFKTILQAWGISVGATGIIAPIVLVLVFGTAIYLLWFFWWAKGFLPQT